MSFTYVAGAAAKDDVRLLIGDVDVNAQSELRLEDEDIARLITLEGDIYRAAAMAAEVLATKFARKAEGSAGPNALSPSNRAQELRATATRLRMAAATNRGPIPSAGGISISGKAAAEAQSDRVKPTFKRGLLDNASEGA